MNPREKYIKKAMEAVREYTHGKPYAATLIAYDVMSTGTHGHGLRRSAFEEIGYPKKRKPSLPDKSNLHPVFQEILAAVAPGVTQ